MKTKTKKEWEHKADFYEEQANELLEALKEIAKGEGAFDMDRLKHAANVIESVISIAKEAIKKAINEDWRKQKLNN